MTVYEKTDTKTLRNWVANGVITGTQANNLIVNDSVKSYDKTLVTYDQLGNFKLVNNSLRFDVVWNTMYL